MFQRIALIFFIYNIFTFNNFWKTKPTFINKAIVRIGGADAAESQGSSIFSIFLKAKGGGGLGIKCFFGGLHSPKLTVRTWQEAETQKEIDFPTPVLQVLR